MKIIAGFEVEFRPTGNINGGRLCLIYAFDPTHEEVLEGFGPNLKPEWVARIRAGDYVKRPRDVMVRE